MTATALSTRQLLARHMRVLRAARAWSQEALAEAAGVHRTYISGIEQMKYNVGIDSLEKIADAFDMGVKQLLAPRLNEI